MKSKPRILVVEDENDVKDLILLHLSREGFQSISASNGEEALKLIESTEIDLMILDSF